MPRAKAPRWKLFLLRRLLRDKRIYNICAALRGPDHFADGSNGQEFFQQFLELKCSTTAVIRYELGLTRSPLLSNKDDRELALFRDNLYRSAGETGSDEWKFRRLARHAIGHAEEAFVALGLNW